MNTLKAMLAFFMGLVPAKSREQRKAMAPLLEVVQAEAEVPFRLKGAPEAKDGPAVEAALQQSVRKAIRLYVPDAPESRLRSHDRRILRRYRDFIESYDVLKSVAGEKQYALVEARVRGEPLRRAIYGMGLRAAGEHLEVYFQAARLRGGADTTLPAGNGDTVVLRKFSGDLYGLGVRYYFSEEVFVDASGMALARRVHVQDFIRAGVARDPNYLRRYFPFNFGLGVKWLDRYGVRATTSLGYGWTRYKMEGEGLSSAESTPRRIGTWVFGNEVQWLPLRHLGAGVRAQYRTKTRFDAAVGQETEHWLLSAQVLTIF